MNRNAAAAQAFPDRDGLYIALFLGLTALAVAGYWMLLPSSADKTPTNATKPPVTTPITAEPVTPDVPEVKPEEPAEPVQSVVEVTVLEKEAEVTEPVTPSRRGSLSLP